MDSIFKYGDTIFEHGIVGFLIYTVVIIAIVSIVLAFIKKAIQHVIAGNPKRNLPFQYIYRIIRIGLWIFALFIISMSIKPIRTISATIFGATSLIGVVLGLAAKESFSNFISGFFIVLYQPFHVGDVVYLPEKNIMGTVEEITFRHTVLRTIENTIMIVPNSTMNSCIVEDKAFGQPFHTRYLTFSVGYGTDMEKLQQVISHVIHQIDGILYPDGVGESDPYPFIVSNFLDSGIEIRLSVVGKDLGHTFELTSKVRQGLLNELSKANIVIPYPIVEIHN